MSPHRYSAARRRHLQLGLLGLAVCLQVACASFNDDDKTAAMVPKNQCVVDDECGDNSRCRGGLCVARSSVEQYVTLRVTPAYQADGTDPLPIQYDLQVLDGPTVRTVELPSPVTANIRVTNEGARVGGTVRIRYAGQLSGMPSLPLAVPLLEQDDTTVVLHEGSDYVVRIEPSDTSLPPLTRLIEDAADGMSIELEYADETFSRYYRVTGQDDVKTLLVRAIDPETRRPVSAVAQTDRNGLVVLKFDGPEERPHIIELSPPAEAKEALVNDVEEDCMVSAISPSYEVASQDLVPASIVDIVLPQVLDPIRYEGEVQLCGNGEALLTTDNTASLGISLRSTQLLLREGAPPTPVRATYVVETTTVVRKSNGDGAHEFCINTLPGEYEVVVNPPPITGNCLPEEDVARCGCGIFAEKVALEPLEAEDATSSPVDLQLPTMASISGELTTEGQDPIVGATIEAIARTATNGINLGDTDRGITGYNRSTLATSGMGGRFRVPLDVGAYDVTVKPPAESGFAWLVLRDVRIADRSKEFSQTLTMGSPVTIDGSLRFLGGGATARMSLAGATVRAYSIVEDPDLPSSRRAIQIGQATADDSGHFMLLVSPVQRQGWL